MDRNDPNECYLCLEPREDSDGGVDADGYGYHTTCEAERQRRMSAGICWACNTPISPDDAVDDNAHKRCMHR